MMKKKIAGWSIRGRPFSPKEYKTSYLKKNTKQTYSIYLAHFAKQYKNKTLRKGLLR